MKKFISELLWCFPGLERDDLDFKIGGTVKYVIHLLASIALAVASAVYLWKIEANTQCMAPTSEGSSDLENVTAKFDQILKIYFAWAVIDVFRSILGIVAYARDKTSMVYSYAGLCMNDLFGISALIVLHVYRFSYSGKYCSGDFSED